MSLEVVQAIGQWIVVPICVAAVVIGVFYFITKD